MLVKVQHNELNGQIVVAKKRVETQQAHQTKVAEHFIEFALGEQVVLQVETLIDVTIRIDHAQR